MMSRMKTPFAIALAALFTSTAFCQSPPVSARQFAEKAFAALPVEEPYAFRRLIEAERDRPRRDPAARPRAGELAIPDSGWSLAIASAAGPVLRTAAEEFRAHLEKAYGVALKIDYRDSLAGWEQFTNAVVAGTRDQMPGCGAGLAGRKDYRLAAAPGRIAACGIDERGAMYALYNLEARFSLREAPFVPGNLNETRRSIYSARMILSGLGWMQWPDWYLRLLPRYGFDAIYASVYANPDGTPAATVYQEIMRKQDAARMRSLVERAGRFGLDVYAPIMFHIEDTPESEARLRALCRKLATEFPEIRGYVLLIEGFDYEKWPGWNRTDIREWIRKWAGGVNIARPRNCTRSTRESKCCPGTTTSTSARRRRS